MSKSIYFLFLDNVSKVHNVGAISEECLTPVKVGDVATSDIECGVNVPLDGSEDIFFRLMREAAVAPNLKPEEELRLCFGLREDLVRRRLVEHYWIQKGGLYFDASTEREQSNYYLYRSLSLDDIYVIFGRMKIDYVPNIMMLEKR